MNKKKTIAEDDCANGALATQIILLLRNIRKKSLNHWTWFYTSNLLFWVGHSVSILRVWDFFHNININIFYHWNTFILLWWLFLVDSFSFVCPIFIPWKRRCWKKNHIFFNSDFRTKYVCERYSEIENDMNNFRFDFGKPTETPINNSYFKFEH